MCDNWIYGVVDMEGMNKNITIIEERIYSLREKMGYTQQLLADKLQVSRSLINNWENGYANISLKQLIKLASIYQVPIDYLLGIIDDTNIVGYHFVTDINLKEIGIRIREIRKNDHLT